ncbi:MAG TPA: PAS domain-containing protein, partial [Telluria sp.]
MAETIRAREWHRTPLGAIDQWGASLRISVTAVLDSPLPTALLWGADLVQVYNDAFADILAERHPAAMGQCAHDCWPEVRECQAHVFARVRGGERVRVEAPPAVIGAGVPQARLFTTTYAPARDEFGAVQGVLVTVAETSEGARALAALRAERDQSAYIFENMAEGFAMIGPDGRVMHMNREGLRLGRRSAAETIGKMHWEVWPEMRGSPTEAVYRRVKESGQAETVEQLLAVSPTENIWLEVRVHRTLAGELAIFYHDISRRKAGETMLIDAARHKDEFLATLAHELRNPLAPICSAAEVLSQGTLAPERVAQVSNVIKRQSANIRNLIDDLLDVSRVTRGFVTLDKVAVDMVRVLRDALEQVAPLLDAHGHQLVTEVRQPQAWVAGDDHRLVQVVANLLSNAIKYTPNGGHIVVNLHTSAETVTLTVSDNGVGMSPALVARAFDLFSQAERTPDRVKGGLGIGLSL